MSSLIKNDTKAKSCSKKLDKVVREAKILLTIMKTKGRAMRMLAMAKELALALTRKARLTAARLTRDMVREKHRKAVKAGFSPEHITHKVRLQLIAVWFHLQLTDKKI